MRRGPVHSIPANGSYMVAAYIVTAVIYLAYTVSLVVRTRRWGRRVSSE